MKEPAKYAHDGRTLWRKGRGLRPAAGKTKYPNRCSMIKLWLLTVCLFTFAVHDPDSARRAADLLADVVRGWL